VISAAGIAVGGMTTARLLPEEMLLRDRRPRRSRVAVISGQEYSESLERVLLSGLRAFHLNLRGKSVMLKPNLVEYIAGVEINTNPLLVGAAAEAFLKLGAKSVVVGEGPGHQRDTYLVLAESGLGAQLHSQKISFVDLNREELFKVSVVNVRTLIVRGKEKRVGRFSGRRPSWKKAFVTLKPGDNIEFFEGV